MSVVIKSLSDDSIERIADAIESGDLEPRAAAAALRGLVLPATQHAQRDAVVFEIRCRRFADRTDNDAALEIAAGLNAYMTRGSWLRGDQTAESCPDRIGNTINGDYWRVLKLVPRALKASRIREIVANLKAATVQGDEQSSD